MPRGMGGAGVGPHRARVLAGVAVAVALLVVSGCGEDPPDDPAAVRAEVRAACSEAAEARAELDAAEVADDDFSRVGVTYATTFRDPSWVMLDANADDALRERLVVLANAMGEVSTGISMLRSAIELRDPEGFADEVATAREALPPLDEAARDLDLDECRPEAEISAWIDEAEARGDALFGAIAPTGDYVTDLGRACDRFVEDTIDDGFPVNAIDAQGVLSSLEQAYELLLRDVEALDPATEDLPAHDELLGLIDQALDTTRRAGGLELTPEERQAVVDEHDEASDGIARVTSALGASC